MIEGLCRGSCSRSCSGLPSRPGRTAPCVPGPAGNVLESLFAISLEGASGIDGSLASDPLTEFVSIEFVGVRYEGVTVVFDASPGRR